MDLPGSVGLLLSATALSAACGFRIFVPPLGLAVAASLGIADLPIGLEWIGSPRVIAMLSLASLIEILGFLLPWFDNLLDSLATPAAVVAGVLVSSFVLGDFDPLTRWMLAVIVGGGASGAVQASTVSARLLSSTTTGGLANLFIATAELCLAAVITLTALTLPALMVAVMLTMALTSYAFALRKRF